MNTIDKRRRVSLEMYPQIASEYISGLSCQKIAVKCGMTPSGILAILKRIGVRPRTAVEARRQHYTLNEKYFDTIDTEAKAYFLGLMYADGANDNVKQVSRIRLQAQDGYILEAFNKALGSNRKLSFHARPKPHHQDLYGLTIKNKHLSLSLTKQGCFPKKSLTLEWPTSEQVPDHLIRHFLRGYFDGDGTIYQKRDVHQYRFSLSVSGPFAKSFKALVERIFGMHVSVIEKKNNKIKEAVVSGARQVTIIMEWIYQDATIYLTRKRVLWDSLKEYLCMRPPKTCRYKGVCFVKKSQKYDAYLDLDRKRYFLGQFTDEKEAAKAYNRKVTELKLGRRLNVVT